MDHHQSYLSQLNLINSKKRFIFLLLLVTSNAWSEVITPTFEKDVSNPDKKIEWGPEVSVSFPSPLQFGAEGYCTDLSKVLCRPNLKYFGSIGLFRYPFLRSSERSISSYGVEFGSRYYPFHGKFFIAGSIGYRQISVAANLSAFQIEDEQVASSGRLKVNAFFLSPTFGWKFPISQKVFFGVDLGAQFPFFPSGSMSLEDSQAQTDSSNSEVLKVRSGESIRRIASLPIPKLTLLSLTWYLD